MTLIALFSDKGSPGVTTLALALAHSWPSQLTVVELDPAGGDLALRLTDGHGRPVLRPEPGLLTFAAAARRDAVPTLAEHGQPLPGAAGVCVLPGLSAPEQLSAMAELWGTVLTSIAADGQGDVIADLGRLHPGSPVFAAASAADVLIGVCSAEPAAMLRMRDRMRHVLRALEPKATRRALVVLVAEDHRAAEAVHAMREVLVRGAVTAEPAGALAIDPIAVRALQAGDTSPRVQRSLLMRSAHTLTPQLPDTPSTSVRGAVVADTGIQGGDPRGTVAPPTQRRRVFARSR